MMRRWVCGVVVVAVVFGSLGWSAPAMAKQPADFYLEEFWVAEFIAFVGGAIGMTVPSSFDTWFESDFCRAAKTQVFLFTNSICGFTSWDTGRALGAGLGVTIVGQSSGVEGNVLMAYLLPWVSMVGTAWLKYLVPETPYGVSGFLHLPFIPAFLATAGYNIGAKMKATGQLASLPWTLDLPVLSLEF